MLAQQCGLTVREVVITRVMRIYSNHGEQVSTQLQRAGAVAGLVLRPDSIYDYCWELRVGWLRSSAEYSAPVAI